MDAEMTEKKLGLSLDDIISSGPKKPAAPAGPRSGKPTPGPRSQQGARPGKRVVPIPARPQGRKAGPQKGQRGWQERAPGLKDVRRLPATSPARLQKLGGGAARYSKQAPQMTTSQLRTNKLQAHQAGGAAARQAAVAQKRGLPISARLAPARATIIRQGKASTVRQRDAGVQGTGVRAQQTPAADLAAGAKWKITIANDKVASLPQAQAIIMPGQQNGGNKRGNIQNSLDMSQHAASSGMSQRSVGGIGGRGGSKNTNRPGGTLSDRFSKIKPASPVTAAGAAQGRASRNAAGVVMPF